MSKLDFEKMQQMQSELQEKYKDEWGGLPPEQGRQKLLWLYGELGEVGDIIKKKGDDKILSDNETRAHFIEEMCDVMMYFNDICLCYGITPQELEDVYYKKHEKNMSRW